MGTVMGHLDRVSHLDETALGHLDRRCDGPVIALATDVSCDGPPRFQMRMNKHIRLSICQSSWGYFVAALLLVKALWCTS
jgi:hypothetical protein